MTVHVIRSLTMTVHVIRYDEGAYAAREMLKALGEEGTDVLFSFAIGDDAYAFETSADAIGNAVDESFGWGRILSDRQLGNLEFNSANTGDDVLSNENLAAMLAQNPEFVGASPEQQMSMIDELRQTTNTFYDTVMDQAAQDGSLAKYMFAAGAQGIANIVLGLAGQFDASIDDPAAAARGAVKSIANLGPELFNGAVNLTKTVLDGYSYGFDALGMDASFFRETEAFNLGMNMEYADDAEQGGSLLAGLVGGAAMAKFGKQRIVIDDIGTTNRQAGAINVRIEGPEGEVVTNNTSSLGINGGPQLPKVMGPNDGPQLPKVMGPNDGPQIPEWKGPVDYSSVKDPKNLVNTKPTPRQVRQMKELNRQQNDGLLRSDLDGTLMIDSKKSTRGVTPPTNEAQVDHKTPVNKGGTRSNTNLQLLTREQNRDKWDN